MNQFSEKIAVFAQQLEAEQIAELERRNLACEANRNNSRTSIKAGSKYTRVDVGDSGKYMVEHATEIIYGIKAYGVIHKGHAYGTLDTIHAWNWSGYSATPKALVTA